MAGRDVLTCSWSHYLSTCPLRTWLHPAGEDACTSIPACVNNLSAYLKTIMRISDNSYGLSPFIYKLANLAACLETYQAIEL